MAAKQDEVIAFLSDPASHDDAPVERIETHCSIIFLAGDRAFKLKRPVAFSSLDYSTLDLREAACRAELAVNRRTAPDLYLGLSSIRRGPHGLQFDGEGEILDWVVTMRRFDQADLFSRMAADGRLTGELIMALSDEIARFHDAAERVGQGAAGLDRAIADNHRDLSTMAGIFGRQAIEGLHKASLAELGRLAGLLDRRCESGHARRGHGDLRLANICLLDGRPTLYDAVEFCDALCCVDRLFDLAFLLADLRQAGLSHFANLLFNRYLDVTGDGGSLAVLPLMLSVRSATRAYALAGQSQRHPEQSGVLQAAAQARLAEAFSLLARAEGRLLAVGGVGGSARMAEIYRLASLLPPAPGARVLRDEAMRHRLLGVPPGDRLSAAAYGPEMTGPVHAALAHAADEVLEADCSAILQAPFATPGERRSIEAALAGRDFIGLWSVAPLPVDPSQCESLQLASDFASFRHSSAPEGRWTMSYAALTVVLQLGCSNAAPLGVADDLAKRVEGPVTGIARAQPMAVLLGDNFYVGEVIEADDKAILEEAKAAETEFRISISGPAERLQWSMQVTSAPLSESIASSAATADLVITGIVRSGELSRSTRQIDVANLIEMAGRPVLVVPHGVAHFDFHGALIAWKESREARRAIADALPLLRMMKRVVVAGIAESADRAEAEGELVKIVAWLGQHGVKAVSRFDEAKDDVGKRLIEMAEEERAELIVAGAYGHSRYREWVLGGVTRTLLERSRCCLLMSH